MNRLCLPYAYLGELDAQSGPKKPELVMDKEAGQALLAWPALVPVELPGTEPAPNLSLTCGNIGFGAAERCESA
jgi:hypothetical protein